MHDPVYKGARSMPEKLAGIDDQLYRLCLLYKITGPIGALTPDQRQGLDIGIHCRNVIANGIGIPEQGINYFWNKIPLYTARSGN